MALLDLPVVDAHVHLWNPDRFKMSWLEGDDFLNRSYEVEEFTEASREVGVEAFVFVETGVEPQYAFLEVEWVANLATLEPRLKGIVAAAPLEHGKRARHYLERLIATSPLVKGVRRLLQGEPDPYFCLQPDFVDGVQLLPELGLSFDICILHHQLPGVIELVKKCPKTSFILDHIAKPAIKSGEFEPWREHIRELAKLPNVACKISGLVTEADHRGWTEAILEPYVAHVVEVFGENRVLFGSDWPVALLASEYSRWAQTLDQLTSHLSQDARRKLWAENARRCYRL
jgi:L-fuconolactonase